MSILDPGPDPNFPRLEVTDYFSFSDPKTWDDDIIGIGGNLSPGMLLSAYEQGIFPWYGPDDPILWQSPDPRCLIFPDTLHVSSSMQKIFAKNVFDITFDENFYGVITGCSEVKRRKQGDEQYNTWITKDIIESYTELHCLGWAHSAEAWYEGELVGGCYGILMGKIFIGESMFSKKSNASKAAFLTLAKVLFEHGVVFIDCQVPNSHLMTLGGVALPRKDFLVLQKKYIGTRF
jgi:leucyl/phenylalanyl-tRNA--protein transferase